ncbi:uncharacterized protein DNG_00311 [Cephalotrichum gorgonifer]|uniref:Uncharacterized protein n=1 Tax=Cephalotrichum gorgonifer TaxID=2041049 RepID=A0AAE8MQY7_9PEZI|nr:uncharacterized protein DNG_00311 [Cephalotrichum gorgonifer]
MKFLSALAFLAASAVATPVEARQRTLLSRYELTISSFGDTPFDKGAVSLRDNKAGYYAAQSEPLVISAISGGEGSAGDALRLTIGNLAVEGYLALEGDSGLRDLVARIGDGLEDPEGERGSFVFEPREDDEDEGLFDVTWGGGEGQWLVENVGGDDYELKWWDGEGFTIATVYPVQLVGRLTAQS